MFPQRVSYLIGPDGVIAKAYGVTDVGEHASTVLRDLHRFQVAAGDRS